MSSEVRVSQTSTIPPVLVGKERLIPRSRWSSNGRACPLPWFHLLQHVNAKRDSIYSKTRQWKYFWLQNATRYVISKWCLIPCHQESIIDCKTRFDSVGRILGAGVPFVYASNVKANLGSLRNLPLKVETLHKSDISGHIICDLSRNISVVPNPQFPLNTELLTTFTFRDPLDSSSLHPTCRHLPIVAMV